MGENRQCVQATFFSLVFFGSSADISFGERAVEWKELGDTLMQDPNYYGDLDFPSIPWGFAVYELPGPQPQGAALLRVKEAQTKTAPPPSKTVSLVTSASWESADDTMGDLEPLLLGQAGSSQSRKPRRAGLVLRRTNGGISYPEGTGE